MIVAGIDEAGRGAVIGPLVIVGVSFEEKKLAKLKKIGVKDSKQLSQKRREKLAKEIEKIAKDVLILKIGACRIDRYRKEGINLNRLEAMRFGEILLMLKADKAYVDAPENPKKLEKYLKKVLGDVELVVEHKADEKYPVVGAASIIAKVVREREISRLRKKYGDFGPGYPSNPKTVAWLKNWLEKHKEFPDIVRITWDTVKQLEKSKKQSRLSKWFSKIKP